MFQTGDAIDCLLFQNSKAQPIAFDDISDHVGRPDRFVWIERKEERRVGK